VVCKTNLRFPEWSTFGENWLDDHHDDVFCEPRARSDDTHRYSGRRHGARLGVVAAQAHDLVFAVYGHVLGLPPETIPPLVARAIAFDSLIVFAIIAYRKRREIRAWYNHRFPAVQPAESGVASLANNVNLSSAP
jgi:hypothetical protein